MDSLVPTCFFLCNYRFEKLIIGYWCYASSSISTQLERLLIESIPCVMNLCFCCSSTSMPVQVRVFYLNHPADHVLTLGCPGARPNMAVAWDRGTEPIYRAEHLAGHGHTDTAPRLVIDTGHHLVFKPAKVQDSGITSCLMQWNHSLCVIANLAYLSPIYLVPFSVIHSCFICFLVA